ncbi:hypothetical protein [Bacillus infantis]|uniref:hypothetical protein n=1 Tax=Bacillus infantis TaxID=324767 RepID=UPI00209CC2C4|nr:hypothetical protein [Bacillus infantis]MCP1160496.1 hypothetical protein [Bacillus infantis]
MTNLFIQLCVVNIDFESESFYTEEMVIKEWSLKNVKISELEISQLFDSILVNKGDWVDFNVYSNKNQICLDIKLLITKRAPLSEEDNKIVDETKILIELFLKEIKIVIPESVEGQTSSTPMETINFLKISLPGMTNPDLREQVLNELHKKGLEPCLETMGISINEAGASGGELEIILAFIGGSINSGITYDLVKMAVKEIPFLKYATVNWSEEKEFSRTKKQIAKRANVNEESLILIDFIENDFQNYIFKSEKNFIFVKANALHDIVKYKLSKSKQEVKELFEREA